MLESLFKNKNLKWVALIAGGFYVYSLYKESQKTALEIALLQRQVDQFDLEFGKTFVNGMKAVNSGQVGVI